ncbi:MAG TPA: 2-amino-4-hydroxy-6-hydroxymethyldihydropteridine diphosphokinase [Anaerolineae bacterium]|nr:2-amino-4-hydroxy-6-hydroxymethyldihydropteridine diphosphokinase [Anaerolineae bacterium]HQK13102.1 2-amino-4-hydroxy-6-hydroxymethyldihydropteridine diphosphokinase [Anaerolineae bacterium]
MPDQIHIKDLLLRTIIGINDEERRNRQDVLINITLFADLRPAGASDQIADAVNYRTITKQVIALVEASHFFTVERLAAEVARICFTDGRVEAAQVRIEKPGALRFARSVGVEIYRTRADVVERRNRVFVTLGSNINPEENLLAATRLLAEHCTLLAVSPVYETLPVGKTDQPNFLNAAALIETSLAAEDLKGEVLANIEQQLGRVRTTDKNDPRTIDLDIALFNTDVLDIGARHIPDPDILKYAHIAVPLADLAPGYRHPETGQTLQEIAGHVPMGGIIRRDDMRLSEVSGL